MPGESKKRLCAILSLCIQGKYPLQIIMIIVIVLIQPKINAITHIRKANTSRHVCQWITPTAPQCVESPEAL